MEINDRKLQRTSSFINLLVTVALGVFLILLSNVIIGDLDNTIQAPVLENFKDQAIDDRYEKETQNINIQIQALQDKQNNISKMIDVAKENKETEQQSFENWVKTRSTLGSPTQDKEVLQRAKKLDEYQAIVQGWQTQWDSIQSDVNTLNKKLSDTYNVIQKNENKAYQQYEEATNSYDLKVFLVRLLFTAPILALGVFFFIRFRRHKFSPLFMGFSLFSTYVFFVGLVPYLPSYGGYIRYTVGVLLTLGLGYYAIKRIRTYIEHKKNELQASTSERADKLVFEIADKAFNNHVCPSCGKDFLVKDWEKLTAIDKNNLRLASNYCRYCGLQIVKNCLNCNQPNYAHLPYCISCGTKIKNDK